MFDLSCVLLLALEYKENKIEMKQEFMPNGE